MVQRNVLVGISLVTMVVIVLVASLTLSNRHSRGGRASGGTNLRSTASVETSESIYHYGESIRVTFHNDKPEKQSWIGLWQAHKAPFGTGFEVDSVYWTYACGDLNCRVAVDKGYVEFGSDDSSSPAAANYDLPAWSLCNGRYVAALMDSNNEVVQQSHPFDVVGGDCEGICQKATIDTSNEHHKTPTPMTPLSKLAFSSNFSPRQQTGPVLWNHVREIFETDLWVWVGNAIMEADGEMMDAKRANYNANKEDEYYARYGPLKEPKIPVTGTWDEHDSGYNNGGKEYDCYEHSQNEFVEFLDLPNDDPRHPAQGRNQQKGVYSSIPFGIPNSNDTEAVGVHLIMLDVRTFRSPTFDDYGPCEGADSTMLGKEQWAWLEKELKKDSEIKVIASGVQVLSPTNQYNIDTDTLCANDQKTFDEAVAAVGESRFINGSPFESWGQIPQERAKLLQLAQQSINRHHTKRVVFLSGDTRWGELSAKEMPDSTDYGKPQTLYEVTASGIDGNTQSQSFNGNRVRARSADAGGDGYFQYECQLPFTFNGQEYDDCTMAHTKETPAPEKPWCSLVNDAAGNHVPGEWGYCQEVGTELVDLGDIGYSNENGCTGSPFHICSARANYGGVEIDWDERTMLLHVFTPHAEDPEAAVIRVAF